MPGAIILDYTLSDYPRVLFKKDYDLTNVILEIYNTTATSGRCGSNNYNNYL